MAVGKSSRSGKITSSSSYISTATTLGFIALCLLGVWILTFSSIIPSQIITITAPTPRSSTHFSTTDPPPIAAFEEDSTVDLSFDDTISSALGRKSGPPNADDNAVDNDREKEDRDRKEQQKKQEEEGASFEKQQSMQMKELSDENRQQKQEEEEEESFEKQQSMQMKELSNENQEQSKKISEEIEGSDDKLTNAETEEIQPQMQPAQKEEIEESKQQSRGESDENQQQPEQQSQKESGDGQNQEQSQQQNEVEIEDQNQNQSQQRQEQKNESGNDGNQQQLKNEEISFRIEDRESDEIVANQEVQQLTESFPEGAARPEIPKGSKARKGSWSTQADESQNEKERRHESSMYGYNWELCNVTAGPDYIPCLDNEKAIKQIRSTRHYQHRERHCPEESPSCLVPIPEGYKRSIEWPNSRDKILYHNVPHTKLAKVKGHQNWVKVTGEYLTFPGGGTQFIHGALHYIDFIQQAVPKIAWGKHTRVILDVGCGVASFGGFLFERDVLAMSFAPKDEHEAQVQFALERGIPAISAVMGSQRLPFPSRVFDIVHCARCRVPWHAEGGTLLLELNRVLRPGGFFVWSATPVYQKLQEDVEIWNEMASLTASMCWDLIAIKKDKLNSVGAAIYRKPDSNECYKNRTQKSPPMCKEDDSNAAWYVPLQTCMHKIPIDSAERGSKWPKEWPLRLQVPPYWLNNTQIGVYGKPAPADFVADYEHWKRVVSKSYLSGLGISWANVRNVMDMRAIYGGFAAALNDLKVWVMNVVNVDSPDTLPIIYERGLFGIYHDWCESFSTYPRTYDLLHADHLFSSLKKRCKIASVMAEIDRIVRPGGKLIVRDESSVVGEVENLLKSLHWEVRLTFSKNQVAILSAQKSDWRPVTFSAYS